MNGEESRAATMLITLRPKPGLEDEYEAWQRDVDSAAKTFEGFVATDLVRPVAGVQSEWVVIYRFDTPDHLSAWLESERRACMIEEGADLLAEPARENALGGGALLDEGVTIMVSHRPKPRHERAFLEIEHELLTAERSQPGYRGSELLRPVPGAREEWTALVRFDNREHAQQWLASPERARLIGKLEPFVAHFDVRTVGSSFGRWFDFATIARRPTPNWKQAMTVLLALYPIVMLTTLYLSPALSDASVPFIVAIFIGNILSVSALTWVFMPLLARALERWLRPMVRPAISIWGTAFVIAVYGVTILIFAFVK